MTVIDKALAETLVDLIANGTACGCCDSDRNHADLIKRALARTPVDWWPGADVAPAFYESNTLYLPILTALRTRAVTWS